MKAKQILFKMGLFFLPAFVSCSQPGSYKAVFLHHSTGGNVYYEGKVKEWIKKYNKEATRKIQITERAYPNKPYEWKNYPFDYWNLWINGACDSKEQGIECMNTLAAEYDVIIFKHCFPGADVLEDTGEPDIGSERKSLENYMVQYRALRDLMDGYPDNIFIVWTLAPLHRLSNTPENALRAKQFVDWVNDQWLTEDGKEHNNILVFDFWELTAEHSENPAQGQYNCLRYEYEKDHESGDSHPNLKANEVVGPVFAEFMTKAVSES
jgi:hypothetical protein